VMLERSKMADLSIMLNTSTHVYSMIPLAKRSNTPAHVANYINDTEGWTFDVLKFAGELETTTSLASTSRTSI
jgi:hypothetical protein